MSGHKRRKQLGSDAKGYKVASPFNAHHLHELSRLGLLGKIWPNERVVMGMLVCKWMHAELPRQVDDVWLVAHRLVTAEGSGQCGASEIAKSLFIFRKNHVTLTWQKGNVGMLVDGFSEAFRSTAKLDTRTRYTGPAHLDVSENEIGKNVDTKMTASLACLLGRCKALTHLNLSSNFLRGFPDWLEGALAECAGLKHLNLNYNGIGDEGMRRLAFALKDCKGLTHLELEKNEISAVGAASIAAVVQQCAAVESLNLNFNTIRAQGAEALAGALRDSRVGELQLAWNWVGKQGARSLGEALGDCAALQVFDLSHNGIGDEGVGALAVSLGRCKALSQLLLRSNDIGNDGAAQLEHVLKSCPALANLDLTFNRVGPAGEERLAGYGVAVQGVHEALFDELTYDLLLYEYV